jgi:hypothetical protein
MFQSPGIKVSHLSFVIVSKKQALENEMTNGGFKLEVQQPADSSP